MFYLSCVLVCPQLQQHIVMVQLSRLPAWARIPTAARCGTAQGPGPLSCIPVYSTAVLRLTIGNNHVQQQASAQSALKWRERYYWLQWALGGGNAEETELILIINKEAVFLSCLWLILSFIGNSLLLHPAQGLVRKPQRQQLMRNNFWMKRITDLFSTSPCFVWDSKSLLTTKSCKDTYL